jgi:hypothetical protein
MKIHEVQVGDRIRSFDFKGEYDCYLEGTVERIDKWYLYFIAEHQMFGGELNKVEKPVRTAREVIRDWSDRIQVI